MIHEVMPNAHLWNYEIEKFWLKIGWGWRMISAQ
jgi:hypothetical protein